MLQIHVYGVPDTAVIAVETEELVANLVEPLHIKRHLLPLGRQVLFVTVNHLAQSISPCLISGKLLVIRDRWLCVWSS